jgi:lysophospholipase L1-like esterase
MKKSRRIFLQKLGVTGLAASLYMPKLSAASPITPKPRSIPPGLTVLFQGDSITDGNRSRNTDWNHVMGHGYAYLIASRLWYLHPEKKLMFLNRGISGNRVRDLQERWQQDTLDLKPDVVSILIGVNDLSALVNDQNPEPVEKFGERYADLLDKTKKALPNAQLVLNEPFILPLGHVDKNTALWEKEIKKQQLLVRELAQSYNAIFVPLQQAFTEACKRAAPDYWIWDGIHPMPAGHELMAQTWIKQVVPKLSPLKD